LAASLVYKSPLVYELVMLALYGRHYPARYRVLADLVPEKSTVLELCCGPGFLYERQLRKKYIHYSGLDSNPRFIARLERLGAQGRVCDLHAPVPLPKADIVLIQASLYHFLPDAAGVVKRMRAAAGKRLIVAEPIRNLSTSRVPLVAALAARQTNAGFGEEARRFTEESLEALFQTVGMVPARAFLIPGGREKVYVFDVAAEKKAEAPLPVSG
jgi:SAM-dependent methyltransferase